MESPDKRIGCNLLAPRAGAPERRLHSGGQGSLPSGRQKGIIGSLIRALDFSYNQVELIDKYGYNPETHVVATYDKYVLEMHRIAGPKSNLKPEGKPTVLLMHGLLSSSNDCIIAGPRKALGKHK